MAPSACRRGTTSKIKCQRCVPHINVCVCACMCAFIMVVKLLFTGPQLWALNCNDSRNSFPSSCHNHAAILRPSCPSLSSCCSFGIIVIICPVFKRFNVGFLTALLYVSVVPSGNSLGNITAFTATQVECLAVPCSVSFSLLCFALLFVCLFHFYPECCQAISWAYLACWRAERELPSLIANRASECN